jgi:hypothetical protein
VAWEITSRMGTVSLSAFSLRRIVDSAFFSGLANADMASYSEGAICEFVFVIMTFILNGKPGLRRQPWIDISLPDNP